MDGDPNNFVRSLYPWIHAADDGTWLWMLSDTTAQGYGMIPWLTLPLTLGEINYIDHGGEFPALDAARYLKPAFVHWKYSSHGLFVEVTDWWCYDRTPQYSEDFDVWESRSHLINLISDTGSHWNSTSWFAPVWAVTPIDLQFADCWLEEAGEIWCQQAMKSLYSDSSQWYCCNTGESETHADGSCSCRNYEPPMREVCGVYTFEHHPMCGKSPNQPLGSECVSTCDFGDMDLNNCDCGLNEYEAHLAQTVEATSDIIDGIATCADIFIDTWRYALESYYRGWNACYEAKERRQPSWFSSLWYQRSPFSQRPGPAPLVQGQLPLSTDSATQQAC